VDEILVSFMEASGGNLNGITVFIAETNLARRTTTNMGIFLEDCYID
jgi:hypothetical protein